MPSSATQEKRSVTVAGAGFSGLAAAYHLSLKGYDVTVIEESSRPGGLISTIDHPLGLVETAANGLLNSRLVEELFAEIGLKVLAAKKAARRRFVYRRGRPRQWPLTILESFSIGRFIARYAISKSSTRPFEGETIEAWGQRQLGNAGTRYLLEAAFQGIYAGDPSRLSASLILGSFLSKKNRSRPRGARGTVTARGGMGELISALHVYLEKRGVRFRFGERFEFDSKSNAAGPRAPVILALSAHAAAKTLATLAPAVSDSLAKIELLPIVTATVFLKEPAPKDYRGFGCLFPPSEKRSALGVLMNDCIFSGRTKNAYSETWIFGGALAPATVVRWTNEEILAMIRDERSKCFDASDTDVLDVKITRWPAALPHYTVELERALPAIEQAVATHAPNVFLIGNYLGEIGLTKILARAANLANDVTERGIWHE